MKTTTIMLRTRRLGLCCLAFLLAFAMTAGAQPLSVALHMQPNPSPYLSDWEQRSETIVLTITNTSAQVQNVYFTGSVTGDNGVSGQTKQGFKPLKPLQVPPNTSTSYTGPQLKGMFVWEEIQSTGVNIDNITRSGMLPAGNYELCITVRSFQTDEVLTGVEPSGCTPSFTIALPQPPVTTTPPCEETVSSIQGQPILFSWMPMVGTPQRVQYRLRIVEIIGNRSANDALQSATTPAVFDKTIIGNSYMLNPVQIVTPDRPGPIRFAWTVTAVDPANKTRFSNDGESEACSFEYDKESASAYGPDIRRLRVPIWVELGKPYLNCFGFGICKIHIDLPGLDPNMPAMPDSRLDPRKPKVYATLLLSGDGKTLTASISESDIKKYQPDKLGYFKGKASVAFEEDNPVAPKIWRNSLHVANPVIIKAGTYPLRLSGAFYIIESMRLEPLGEPPFYADIPPNDSVVKDTVPCKELEEKVKAAETALEDLRNELTNMDLKIAWTKKELVDCNAELEKLLAAYRKAKERSEKADQVIKNFEKNKTEPSERAKEEQKAAKAELDAALAAWRAKKAACDKLAADIKAHEARKAALPGLIRTAEDDLGKLKEALEKCRKKEAEDKKKKAAGGTTAGAGEGPGSSGSGSSVPGIGDPRHPGTGAGKGDKPCDPEGADATTGPFKEWDPCRVEEIELTPCNVTRSNHIILEYAKKILKRLKPLSTATEMAEHIAEASSLHKAVCVNIHIVRDWKLVTYHWKCIQGKWVFMRKSEAPGGQDDHGWHAIDDGSNDCCWILPKGVEPAEVAELRDGIQAKLDQCK